MVCNVVALAHIQPIKDRAKFVANFQFGILGCDLECHWLLGRKNIGLKIRISVGESVLEGWSEVSGLSIRKEVPPLRSRGR